MTLLHLSTTDFFFTSQSVSQSVSDRLFFYHAPESPGTPRGPRVIFMMDQIDHSSPHAIDATCPVLIHYLTRRARRLGLLGPRVFGRRLT